LYEKQVVKAHQETSSVKESTGTYSTNVQQTTTGKTGKIQDTKHREGKIQQLNFDTKQRERDEL